jgi:hypothetical protein
MFPELFGLLKPFEKPFEEKEGFCGGKQEYSVPDI